MRTAKGLRDEVELLSCARVFANSNGYLRTTDERAISRVSRTTHSNRSFNAASDSSRSQRSQRRGRGGIPCRTGLCRGSNRVGLNLGGHGALGSSVRADNVHGDILVMGRSRGVSFRGPSGLPVLKARGPSFSSPSPPSPPAHPQPSCHGNAASAPGRLGQNARV